MPLILMSLNNFYSPTKELCKVKVYASQYFPSLQSSFAFSFFFGHLKDIGHPESSNSVFVHL